MSNNVSSSETYEVSYQKYTMYLYKHMILAYWAGLTSFSDPVLGTEGMLEGYKEMLTSSPSRETLDSIKGIAGIYGILWDETKFLEYTKSMEADRDIEGNEQDAYHQLLALCNAIYFIIPDLEEIYEKLKDGKYKKIGSYIVVDGITNPAIYHDAHIDDIMPAVNQFLNGDFKTWCEQTSMELAGVDDPRLSDIDSPQMAIIKGGYLKFQHIALKLREYVDVESMPENRDEEERQMLLDGLFSLKFQLDAISSGVSIKNILLQINQNATPFYERGKDIIDEETGEIIKTFTKKVAYIYESTFYVYHTYFKIAVRELQLLLDSYVKDSKMGKEKQFKEVFVWNYNINVLKEIFYDLSTDIYRDGKPLLLATKREINKFILEHFNDITDRPIRFEPMEDSDIKEMRVNCRATVLANIFFQLFKEYKFQDKYVLQARSMDMINFMLKYFKTEDGGNISTPSTLGSYITPSRDQDRPEESTKIELKKYLPEATFVDYAVMTKFRKR